MNTVLRAQQRYRDEAVLSASPARLVTMLYDRLLVDVERAEHAQSVADWQSASRDLQHAQDIVAELAGSLTDVWDGSAQLRALYAYLARTLISANIERNAEHTRQCRELIAPLREAWHAAAEATAS